MQPLLHAFAEQPLLAVGLGAGLLLALLLGWLLGRRRAAPRLEPGAPAPEIARAEPATAETEQVGAGLAEPARAEPEAPVAPAGLLDRMAAGLARTRQALGGRLQAVFGRARIDEALFEELQDALLMADVGVAASSRLVEHLREDQRRGELSEPAALRVRLRRHLVELLHDPRPGLAPQPAEGPLVILVVGINGGGKTTTIGKLAARYAAEGRRVLLGAGDTFRAGAIEQLRIWAERAGAEIVAHAEGADPAAVLFDALQAARARGCDVVICDTAGRLQSRKPLMDQLGKVTRVLGKAVPGAPHEVLLVLDATIGQNALSQARVFGEVVGVTGIVLTKLDGTAKGGVVVAVRAESGVPVKFVGVGEKVDDLRPFDAEHFSAALLDIPA